jgi:hypothetical protein
MYAGYTWGYVLWEVVKLTAPPALAVAGMLYVLYSLIVGARLAGDSHRWLKRNFLRSRLSTWDEHQRAVVIGVPGRIARPSVGGKRPRPRRSPHAELGLVALVDVLMVLVFYLLPTFSQAGELL